MTVDRAQTSAHRRSWEDLPDEARTAVEAVTGRIRCSTPVIAGFSAHLAEIIDVGAERLFVKGLRAGDPEVWSQQREAELGRYVHPIGPQVRWHLTAGGWDLVVFDYIPGHFADYRSDADLAETAAAMTALGRLRCPQQQRLQDAVHRWGSYLTDTDDVLRFGGDALLHTDWNYSNVLITDGDARLVDWPWATRGAPWIDPCCWIVWLVFAGRTPAEAEQWAARVPAWHAATDRDLEVFATALAAEWTSTAHRNPNEWTYSLRDAARQWMTYRWAPESDRPLNPAAHRWHY
ncbi:hypothetical protein [Nocardia sp. alder85J]|uniref:hypothetical protein n=1 Tax=Nocardia sp. alder85J TaxID=2862949 RepID=UPI001CD34123|nr:hypothetical protein [Nocardia sp. alder85J]MCX4092621.1 hypothetical protein [Nocardia sp. alder85J]